uniref:SAM domain-containing protein n=1 Tax=Scylla olivacea TaxID=85551 RepID=A0A0P4WGF7_SCYOL
MIHSCFFNRYNVGCSKRIGLFRNQEESPTKRMREEGNAEPGDVAPQLEPAESQDPEGTEMETGGEAADADGTSNLESPSGCKEYAEDFALQEIDGQALMLLKADHLMSAMSMKLGPALLLLLRE